MNPGPRARVSRTDMIRTIVNLAVVALVALALSFFGMEKFRQSMPGFYSGFAAVTGTKVDYRAPEPEKAPAGEGKEEEEEGGDAKPGTGKSVERVASLKPAGSSAPGAPGAAADASDGGADDAEASVVQVAAGDGDEGPDPRGAINEDPGLPMGVLELDTTVYDGSMGPYQRPLPGGTVVAWGEMREYNKGKVYQCNVLQNRKWQNTRVWIYETDILRLDVTYEEAPRVQRDAIVDYCRAKAEYAKLAAEAKTKAEARSANPYAAEYEAAYAKHADLERRIKENREKVEWSQFHTDPKRGEYLKEGRKLRDEQIADKKTFEPIYRKWKEWEDGHPHVEEAAEPEETPKMRSLRAAMEELAPTVHEIFPTL